MCTLEERSRRRRERIVAHKASSFADAEQWDLDYWQSLTPADRLEAYRVLMADIEALHPDGGAWDEDEDA